MTAKASTPSDSFRVSEYYLRILRARLTHPSHDLRLHPELVREPTREIAYTTIPITRNVWNLPDMIEHMSTCKQEYCDQTDRSPEISVLDQG
jgi:hypothetical protein